MLEHHLSPQHLSQVMDRVEIVVDGGHRVTLVRIKDHEGMWLGMREVYNKLASLQSWQHFHKTSQEGGSIGKESDCFFTKSGCMPDRSSLAHRGHGFKTCHPWREAMVGDARGLEETSTQWEHHACGSCS